MRRLAVASVLVIAAACTGSDPAFTPSGPSSTLDGGSSSPTDGSTDDSDAATGFGAPTVGPFTQVNTTDWVEEGASLTADELTLYYSTNVGGTDGRLTAFKIYRATRASTNEPFGPGQIIEAFRDATTADRWPVVSPDDDVIYFSRMSSPGRYDLWQATRSGTDWTPPSQVQNVVTQFPFASAILEARLPMHNNM